MGRPNINLRSLFHIIQVRSVTKSVVSMDKGQHRYQLTFTHSHTKNEHPFQEEGSATAYDEAMRDWPDLQSLTLYAVLHCSTVKCGLNWSADAGIKINHTQKYQYGLR